MIPPPMTVGLTLCHYVMVEEGTKNVSLIGGFSKFRGRAFPFTPSPLLRLYFTDGRTRRGRTRTDGHELANG